MATRCRAPGEPLARHKARSLRDPRSDYGVVAVDHMLAALRADPRFRALLDRARTDVAAQRARARQRGLLDFAPLLGRPLE
jgi:hypothetical protein